MLWDTAKDTLLGYVTKVAIEWLGKNLLVPAGKWLASLLTGPVGWAGQLLTLAYRGLSWLICQGKCLLKFLAPVLQVIKGVLGQEVWETGQKVLGLVIHGAPLALDAVFQFTAGIKPSEVIGEFLAKLRDKVRELVKAVLQRLLGKSGKPAEIKPQTCPLPRKQKSPPGMMPVKPKRMKCRSSCSPAETGQCFVGWTLVLTRRGKVKIRRRLVLEQVLTYPGAELAPSHYLPGEEWRWSIFEVVLRYDKANWVRAVLLRPANWAVASTLVTLNLPEMGVVGDAWVAEVSPCPPLPTPRAGYRLVCPGPNCSRRRSQINAVSISPRGTANSQITAYFGEARRNDPGNAYRFT